MAARDTDQILRIDDELTALTLQLQEIQAQLERGKYREDEPPDSALAFLDFESELRKKLLCLEDLRIAHSISQPIDTDADAVEELGAEERQAHQDWDFALRLSEGNPENEHPKNDIENVGGRQRRPEVAGVEQRVEQSTLDTKPEDIAGPSFPYTPYWKKAYEPLPLEEVICAACIDSFHPDETTQLNCSHTYCNECLKSFFIRASSDESLFPPKCCTEHIPVSLIEAEFSVEESQAFHDSEVEFSTSNRIYCARSACSKFIPPAQASADTARCTACNTETCIHCKSLAHVGECPEDQSLQALKALAEGKGWQRCFGCNTMVELTTGCNHMTCQCSAEFCYVCGVKWKQCQCAAWDEENLLERAEFVVDREAVIPIPVAERQVLIRNMQQELQENHECGHGGRWERRGQYRRRGYKCELCDTRHWKYILVCRHCHLMACEECRRHRV